MPSVDEKAALRLKRLILSSTKPDEQMKMIDTLAKSYSQVAENILLGLVEAIADSEVKKHALDALQEVKDSF